jgi:hypothetical protein
MTHPEHNRPARRRGELTNDRGSRRISAAINAQRRLNSRRADGPRIKADPFDPSDPSFAYPRRVHD